MSKRKQRYTSEEDEAIFKAVKDSTSLKSCFLALAEELNRSEKGIANRWYRHLSNPESPFYKGTAMLLLKEHRAAQNRTTFKFPVETKKTIWVRIKRLLHL